MLLTEAKLTDNVAYCTRFSVNTLAEYGTEPCQTASIRSLSGWAEVGASSPPLPSLIKRCSQS